MLHGEAPEHSGRRTVAVCWPTDDAVVLGSTQPASDFSQQRLEAAGLALVRRRSGGGAVLVRPDAQAWVDVFVPRGDPLFDHDVGRSFGWLGRAFAAALSVVLEPGRSIEVHPGPPRISEWSAVLCFAGIGSGEVLVDGRKVVGMSQRRDRSGAWFHAMVALDDETPLAGLLERSDEARSAAGTALAATGLEAVRDPRAVAAAVASALVGQLPD